MRQPKRVGRVRDFGVLPDPEFRPILSFHAQASRLNPMLDILRWRSHGTRTTTAYHVSRSGILAADHGSFRSRRNFPATIYVE